MNSSKFFVCCIAVSFLIVTACSKLTDAKHTNIHDSKDTVEESISKNTTNSIDSIVTEEFARLLRYSYPMISQTGEIGHYFTAIPNLGPKGETTVYVCVGEAMYDHEADGIFLLTNSTWDNPDYFESRDCLILGPELEGDSYLEGDIESEMTYKIHDSILTIKIQETKSFHLNQTETDSLVGSMIITHTYSVRYWSFRYLSSDTVLYGDTAYLCSVFNHREAHLGYKISDPMQYRDEPPMYNDPRWAYAEEKLWNPEVCAYLCDIAKVSDGYLTEILGILFYESLHNNPETNRCMAEYLASLPPSEQEEQLTRLLNTMWLELFEYKSGTEQPIYSDFDTFIKHFPVFNTSYNGQARREYIELINNMP